MQQVLFWIPIKTAWSPDGIPIYAYGTMLFLCFVSCIWFASRVAIKRGLNITRDRVQDMAIVVFVLGLAGARITYMLQFNVPLERFFRIWEGGIVLYGGLIGGTLAFLAFYHYVFKPLGVNLWQLGDVIAPTLCIGVALGRVGCLLNGCCYGNPAGIDEPSIHFPLLTAPARDILVEVSPKDEKRYPIQTLLGFSYRVHDVGKDSVLMLVDQLEPGSEAAQSGLLPGDKIVKVKVLDQWQEPQVFLRRLSDWPRGRNELQVMVEREGEAKELPAFTPRSVGLHPTQLYETISMVLLMLLLLAYYPFRRHDGQVFVLLMIAYSFHRFVNEILRTEPVEGFQMTLSQLISVGVLATAIAMEIYLRRTKPSRYKLADLSQPAGTPQPG